jgi:hypothetical protein
MPDTSNVQMLHTYILYVTYVETVQGSLKLVDCGLKNEVALLSLTLLKTVILIRLVVN